MPSTPTDAAAPASSPDPSADVSALGFLLQLGDSGLPTGAFSHSFGFETLLAEGRLESAAALTEWLRSLLDTQLSCTEALALRWTADGERDPHEVDALVEAATAPAQVRAASRRMGAQLVKLVPQLFSQTPSVADAHAGGSGAPPEPPAGRWPRHYPVVYGLLGAAARIPTGLLIHTFLTGSVTSLVQNAVRAVPLGQSAGQRVITSLREPVAAAAAEVMRMDDEAFATTAPGLEIAQMRHEHQHARMFMS